MIDFFDRVKAERDPLKKLVALIPGFSGYVERQTRRDADRLVRETVVRRFEDHWKRASNLQNELVNAGLISYVDDTEKAALQLRTFIDKIKAAPLGYAGLFDAVRINEKELEALYQFDLAFFELSDQVGRALDALEMTLRDEAGLPAAIRNLVDAGRLAIETYDRRNEAILGGSKPQPTPPAP